MYVHMQLCGWGYMYVCAVTLQCIVSLYYLCASVSVLQLVYHDCVMSFAKLKTFLHTVLA